MSPSRKEALVAFVCFSIIASIFGGLLYQEGDSGTSDEPYSRLLLILLVIGILGIGQSIRYLIRPQR